MVPPASANGFSQADIQVDELLSGASNAHTVIWTAPSGGNNWSRVGNADQVDGEDTGTVFSVIDVTLPHTPLPMVGKRYSGLRCFLLRGWRPTGTV